MARYETDSAAPIQRSPSLFLAPQLVKIDGIPHPVSGPRFDPDNYESVELPDDPYGADIDETLRLMAAISLDAASDPYFVEEARSIIRELPDRDYEAYEGAILDYVWKPVLNEDTGQMEPRVRYREGPIAKRASDGREMLQFLQHPGWLLFVSGTGLCADMAALIGALDLANGLGFSLKAFAIDPTDPGRYSHVLAAAIGQDRVERAQDPVPRHPVLGAEPPRSMWTAPPKRLVGASP